MKIKSEEFQRYDGVRGYVGIIWKISQPVVPLNGQQL